MSILLVNKKKKVKIRQIDGEVQGIEHLRKKKGNVLYDIFF